MGDAVSIEFQNQIETQINKSLDLIIFKFIELVFTTGAELVQFLTGQFKGLLKGLGDMIFLSILSGNYSPQVENLVTDFFGGDIIISQFNKIVVGAFNQLFYTFVQQILVVLQNFKLLALQFPSLLQNGPDQFIEEFDYALNALFSFFSIIKELIEENPSSINFGNMNDFDGILTEFFEFIEIQESQETLWMNLDEIHLVFQNNVMLYLILGGVLGMFWMDITPNFPELLQQLTNYALDFGELIVNALSGISDSLQG